MGTITTDAMTKLMVSLLEAHGYVVATEVCVMTGGNTRNNGGQRIDVWGIHPYPSKKMLTIAIEVKASRSDWLNELKKPRKRNYAMMYSNEFYVVAPAGVVLVDELPREMGLVMVYPYAEHVRFSRDTWGDLWGWDAERQYTSCMTIKAPYRDSFPPSWPFVASLLRKYANGRQRSE